MQAKISRLENEIARLKTSAGESVSRGPASTPVFATQEAGFRPVSPLTTGSSLSIQFDPVVSSKVMAVLYRMIGIPPSLSSPLSNGRGGAASPPYELLARYVEQRPFYVVGVTGHSYPIIYASPSFAALSGYGAHEIIGRNCGFLHGPDTDKSEVRV